MTTKAHLIYVVSRAGQSFGRFAATGALSGRRNSFAAPPFHERARSSCQASRLGFYFFNPLRKLVILQTHTISVPWVERTGERLGAINNVKGERLLIFNGFSTFLMLLLQV